MDEIIPVHVSRWNHEEFNKYCDIINLVKGIPTNMLPLVKIVVATEMQDREIKYNSTRVSKEYGPVDIS